MYIHRSKKFSGVVVHVSDSVYREAQEIAASGPSMEGDSMEEVLDHQYEEMFGVGTRAQFLEFVRLHGAQRGCPERTWR